MLKLTRVGVWVAVSFGPLVGGGLLVEVILRLHQRERLCKERATAYRLVVPQTAVTAALLGAVRQVKRDAPLGLEPRAQNRASDVSALLCPLKLFLFTASLHALSWTSSHGSWAGPRCERCKSTSTPNGSYVKGLVLSCARYRWKGSSDIVNTVTFHCTVTSNNNNNMQIHIMHCSKN